MMTVLTREEKLDNVLRDLLEGHFFNKELEWGHRDTVSLFETDIDLYLRIAELVPEIIKGKE